MTDRSYMLDRVRLDRFREFLVRRHPTRRHRRHGAGTAAAIWRGLGLRALFVGFMATLLNAAIAGVFLQ